MDRVGAWRLRAKSVNLICQAVAGPDAPNLPEYNFRSGVTEINRSGPWRVGTVEVNQRTFSIYLYRKRAIVCWHIEKKQQSALKEIDVFIRFYLTDLAKDMQAVLTTAIEAPSVTWRAMPMLLADLKIDPRHQQPWISDGVTSFQMRLYDSSKQRAGIVRISRHLVLCAGLGSRLQQDIVNLIYEKLLYYPQVDTDRVFSLIDGLSRYVLPTELNIFLQGAVARLTVVFSVSALIIAVMQIFIGNLDVVGKIVALVIAVIFIVATWLLTRYIRLLEWE